MTKARPGTGLWARPNMRDYHVRAPLGSGFYFDSVNPASAYTLYPSTDKGLYFGVSGGSTEDYASFGAQSINPIDNSLGYIFVDQPDHNSSRLGDIMAIRSTDVWGTIAQTKTIATDPDGSGGVGLTSVDIFCDSGGRTFFMYSKQEAGGISIPYLKYTDDADWTTLSSEIRFTMDFDGQYLDATGSMWEVGGILYKCFWASTGVGGTSVPIYKSTDRGDTWTFHANISSTLENFDETEVYVHPVTGDWWAAQRDNNTDLLVIKKSLAASLGAVWTGGHTNMVARGRNGFVITPNGMFCIVTRYPTGGDDSVTTLIQSRDGVTFTQADLDARDANYMYGRPIWHPVEEKIISLRSIEMINSTVFQGPCIIIKKDIVESATPVSPPTAYLPEYQSVLDAATSTNYNFNIPSDTLKGKHNDLLQDLIDAGIAWDKLWIFAHNDANMGNLSLINWKKSWNVATLVNAPTYGVGGYVCNGTTQRISLGTTGVISQAAGNVYTRNDAGCFYYTPDTAIDAGFGRNFGITPLFLISRASDTNLYYRINDATNSTIVAPIGATRFFLQRTDANTKKIWTDGTNTGTASVASIDIAAQTDIINMNCLNAGAGNFQNFSVKRAGIFMLCGANVGKEATLDSIMAAYISSIGL